MEILSTALLLIIFSYLLYISTRRPPNFPPGLRRIPIIGQTFKGSRPVLWLWRKHKIMGHFIGNTPAVTIQDFQLARELLSREEWCGRGHNIITRYFRSDNGVTKVGSSTQPSPASSRLTSAGHHRQRRGAVAGTPQVRSQTSQGFRFRENWTGRSHSRGSRGHRETSLKSW